MADSEISEKLFGKASPPAGRKYDFARVKVRNPRPGIVVLSWVARGVGFGEVSMIINKDRIHFETECMSNEFIEELFGYVVEHATKDPDESPKPMSAQEYREEFDFTYADFLRHNPEEDGCGS